MRAFYKYWKRLLVKRVLVKDKNKKQENFQLCIHYESNENMLRILLFKKYRLAHHTSCNWKLIISYSILG